MVQTMDLVRLQLKRIEADARWHRDTIACGNASEVMNAQTSLFADIHYMLITLHNVEQLFSRLEKLTPHESDLMDVRKRHRKWLKTCGEFRTSLDHSDLRVGHGIDSGRLDGGYYCLNGYRLDIGPSLSEEVEFYFKDVTTAWERVVDRRKRLRELISKRSELAS